MIIVYLNLSDSSRLFYILLFEGGEGRVKREDKIAKLRKKMNDNMKFINEEGFASEESTHIETIINRLVDSAFRLKHTLLAGK